MIHFGFRVFDFNWLVLRKGLQTWGFPLTPGFCTWETQRVIIYIYSFWYTLVPASVWVIKVIFKIYNGSTIHYCLMTRYFRGREITKKLGAQCWRHMWWTVTWMFRFMGYLPPVQLGEQSHLILGRDHHQPSPQTPLVSYEYFDKTKQGCLSSSHDSLSTS